MPLRLESSISILKTTHLTLTAFPFILLLAGTVANGSDVRDANKVTEQMLETLGGREAWAKLKNTVNGSVQNRSRDFGLKQQLVIFTLLGSSMVTRAGACDDRE
jgi:hypothetical protein